MSKASIEKMIRFYSTFINPLDLCFDIGANIGDRTAALLLSGNKVVAIEPQPECVKHIRKRFQTKIDEYKLIVIQNAVGSKEGSAKLQLTRTSTIASMNPNWIQRVKERRFKKFNWNRSIEVRVQTLDKLIAHYGKPEFIKIDVEGYELEVLKGLSQKINFLAFEFTPEIINIATGCVDRLRVLSSNYKYNYSEGESMVMKNKLWVGPDEIIDLLNKTQGSPIFGDVYAKLDF